MTEARAYLTTEVRPKPNGSNSELHSKTEHTMSISDADMSTHAESGTRTSSGRQAEQSEQAANGVKALSPAATAGVGRLGGVDAHRGEGGIRAVRRRCEAK
jgi:hypothetical protein